MTEIRTREQSYDPEYFGPLFAIEERHFWFRGRNAVLGGLVSRLTVGLADGYRVLEVGCGTGNVLRALEQACPRGQVVGMDLFHEGLRFARRRTGSGLVQGDAHMPPFAVGFDLIGLFDVLEHLEDDRGVLRDLCALLVPGGALVVTVPAHRALWSYFDEESRHVRRYEREELRARLEETGLEVELLSPYMASIFPVVWLTRRAAGSQPGGTGRNQELTSRELKIVPGVNEILAGLIELEAKILIRGGRLPFGTSLIAVARKKGR